MALATKIDRRSISMIGEKSVSPQSENQWDFLRSILHHKKERSSKSLEGVHKHYNAVQKAAMNENSGLTGGYIVPLEYSTILLRAVDEHSFIRPRAQIVPMNSLETLCPKLSTSTAQSAGTSPFFGGLNFTWGPSQGSALTESEPTFGQLSLKACDLIGQLIVSNQFVQDIGPEGEKKLTELFGKAIAWSEEYAFLRGTGSANLQPIGMVNAGCAIAVTRAGAGHVAQADIAGMIDNMLPYSWTTAIWACSPTCLTDIYKLTAFVPNEDPMGTEMGCAGSLMTRPLFVTEKLPAMGTKGDLILTDPNLYVIGDRQETIVDLSEVPLFNKYQTVFRVVRRLDGKPLLDTSVTLADGASTASSVVVLN